MVVAAVGSLADVVGLEPVSATASFDGALSPVPFEYERPDRRWDRFGSVGNRKGAVAVGVDDAGAATAEDLGEGVGADPEAAAGGGAGFSPGWCGDGGVYEDFGHDDGPAVLLVFGSAGQAVEANIGEGVCQLSALGLVGVVGERGGSLPECLVDDVAIDPVDLSPQLYIEVSRLG